MGGVLRVLRYGMGQSLTWPIDEADETLLTKRQASVLATFALYLMTFSYAGWVRSIGMSRVAR